MEDEIKRNIQRKSSISVDNTVNITGDNNKVKVILNNAVSDFSQKTKDVVKEHEDSGSSTISTGISIGEKSVNLFKTSQRMTPTVIKLSQGTYKIGANTLKVASTASETIGKIAVGKIKLDKNTIEQLKNIVVNKVMSLESVQKVRSYSLALKSGAVKTVSVARGIVNGSIKINAKDILNVVSSSSKKVGEVSLNTIKTGAVSFSKVGVYGAKKGVIGLSHGIDSLSENFSKSNDLGLQTANLGIKTAQATVQTIKAIPTGIKATKYVVTAPYKVGKKVYKTGKNVVGFVKNVNRLGLKEAVRHYRSEVLKNIANAGKSVVNLLIEGVKKIGIKFALPALILVAIVTVFMNTVNLPTLGVSSFFGGVAHNKDTGEDFEARKYLQTAIQPFKSKFVSNVLSIKNENLIKNGGEYHYIRLFKVGSDEEIDISESNILGTIYSDEELISVIEPVFSTKLLTDYNLNPTQAQIDSTLKDIWNTIIKVDTKELPMEYCNPADKNGNHHANINTCPDYITGKHTSYTDPVCCYKKKHTKTNLDGTKTTYTTEECNGYYYCQGHKILAINVNIDGYYELLDKYYTREIERLANLPSRTQDEESKLQSLKDSYNLCLAYIDNVMKISGDSRGNTDMSGVVLINGSRPGNNEIINIAQSQLNQVGGQPYWSWYGFKGRVEWCACFVSWCSNQLGYIENGSVPKFCGTKNGVSWFKSHGQWSDNEYSPVAGDIIFFDWDGDGLANHVGLAIGNDGERVYTIEGNSGDVCRRRSYPIHSRVILGYGLPNY